MKDLCKVPVNRPSEIRDFNGKRIFMEMGEGEIQDPDIFRYTAIFCTKDFGALTGRYNSIIFQSQYMCVPAKPPDHGLPKLPEPVRKDHGTEGSPESG